MKEIKLENTGLHKIIDRVANYLKAKYVDQKGDWKADVYEAHDKIISKITSWERFKPKKKLEEVI